MLPSKFNGRKKVFLKMMLGLLDIHMQKNEVGPLFYTTYEN
jgi:hypothetical protein